MGDQKISLKWEGKGFIQSDNVTPVTLILDKKQSHGKPDYDLLKLQNLILEGDNAPIMKSMCAGTLRLKHKVDLMLWDPPYNTGNKDFIYEDNFYLTKKEQAAWKAKGGSSENDGKWDKWVNEFDGSRHSKWLSFMAVRLELAKKLLKDTGIMAVHISQHELFRLGLLMDEIFGEENRLGIINWECTYSPKNDNKGIPATTDYILIYAKNREMAFRGILPRTAEMDARYKSPDGDKPWKSKDLSAASGTENYLYGIENPFTREIHYPPGGRHWSRPIETARRILSEWGVEYRIKDGNCIIDKNADIAPALKILKQGHWPAIYFGQTGQGRPAAKHYKTQIRTEGRVVGTYWEFEDIADNYEEEEINYSMSHESSGHNDAAKKLMKAVLGDKCPFDTPKPLKLTERLVEMFCPKDGVVLDAFGGSATTAHAVLHLNLDPTNTRRFIIIERGSAKNGYADTITAERIRRVIDGNWVKPKDDTLPTGGSFVYMKAGKPISGKYILESKREELIDIILTAHEGSKDLGEVTPTPGYIIGKTLDGQGIALVWDPAKGTESSKLTVPIYKEIMAEATRLGLTRPVFIYAAVNEGPNGSKSYTFQPIPDQILAALEIKNLSE